MTISCGCLKDYATKKPWYKNINLLHNLTKFVLRIFPKNEVKSSMWTFTADFIAMYTPGFSDMIRRSWFDLSWFDTNHVTYRLAVNGCKNSAVGSKTVREKSGRQGKLSTNGHKCNEARIPTKAFYLKRKALLPGKRRHDTEIMITCHQVINLEFDCRVRMYFCRRFHNGRNIINTAKSKIVRWFII